LWELLWPLRPSPCSYPGLILAVCFDAQDNSVAL
jgi:hypothetical protein